MICIDASACTSSERGFAPPAPGRDSATSSGAGAPPSPPTEVKEGDVHPAIKTLPRGFTHNGAAYWFKVQIDQGRGYAEVLAAWNSLDADGREMFRAQALAWMTYEGLE